MRRMLPILVLCVLGAGCGVFGAEATSSASGGDLGLDWWRLDLPDEAGHNIAMESSPHGLLLTDGVGMWRTEDLREWERLPLPAPVQPAVSRVDVAAGGDRVALARVAVDRGEQRCRPDDGESEEDVELWITEDAGLTWAEVAVPEKYGHEEVGAGRVQTTVDLGVAEDDLLVAVRTVYDLDLSCVLELGGFMSASDLRGEEMPSEDDRNAVHAEPPFSIGEEGVFPFNGDGPIPWSELGLGPLEQAAATGPPIASTAVHVLDQGRLGQVFEFAGEATLGPFALVQEDVWWGGGIWRLSGVGGGRVPQEAAPLGLPGRLYGGTDEAFVRLADGAHGGDWYRLDDASGGWIPLPPPMLTPPDRFEAGRGAAAGPMVTLGDVLYAVGTDADGLDVVARHGDAANAEWSSGWESVPAAELFGGGEHATAVLTHDGRLIAEIRRRSEEAGLSLTSPVGHLWIGAPSG